MKETMTGKKSLVERHCKPPKANMPPMKGEDLAQYRDQLGKGWNVIGEHHLEKEFKLKDWREAADLTRPDCPAWLIRRTITRMSC